MTDNTRKIDPTKTQQPGMKDRSNLGGGTAAPHAPGKGGDKQHPNTTGTGFNKDYNKGGQTTR